jgi:hypothetical protein
MTVKKAKQGIPKIKGLGRLTDAINGVKFIDEIEDKIVELQISAA